MAYLEDPEASFNKRFMATHFSYRDFHTTVTGDDPTADAATYTFGTNARAVSIDNWPAGVGSPFIAAGDYKEARSCIARSVMIQCTEDVWVSMSSINPRWLKRLNQYIAQGDAYTVAVAKLVTDGINASISEVPTFIPAEAMVTLNPTFGASIIFWQATASGTIRIWIEGNTEGRE